MALRLTKGTKEKVPVVVNDVTGVVSDLAGTSPTYDLLKDDNSTIYSGASATPVGMRLDCLLDLSASGPGGLIAANTHLRLFVSFTISGEVPRLGPVDIMVMDQSSSI